MIDLQYLCIPPVLIWTVTFLEVFYMCNRRLSQFEFAKRRVLEDDFKSYSNVESDSSTKSYLGLEAPLIMSVLLTAPSRHVSLAASRRAVQTQESLFSFFEWLMIPHHIVLIFSSIAYIPQLRISLHTS